MEIQLGHSVWIGMVATSVMTGVLYLLPVVGFPKTDVAYFLGSFLKFPRSRIVLLGLGIHFATGIIFAFLYGLGFLFLDVNPRWWVGALGGIMHWFAIMMSMDMLGEINREVKEGRLRKPGLFMSNLGIASAVASLARHISFGTTVGLLYGLYGVG
ncbi:hypothetical protein M1O29_03570 [Dehalococcoidia bacterium]|nr:hypothetical protein [Dehalococcoidia bacterium]